MGETCPVCQSDYSGYHYCDDGTDRVEYDCSDCGEHVHSETHQFVIEGIPPSRCVQCTFDRMG